MDILLVLAVVVFALILIGVMMGKLSWERAVTLLIVLIVVFVLAQFLLGRM